MTPSGNPNPSTEEFPQYPRGRLARVCRTHACGRIIRHATKIPRFGNAPPMKCPNCGELMEITVIYNYPSRYTQDSLR